MAAEPFIYCGPPDSSGRILVSGDEAVHLIRALRARPGFQFTAFDGTGGAWLSQVTDIKRSAVLAQAISPLPPEDMGVPLITVAVGVVKGSRMDWAVEKAAELGAARFIPLLTKFGGVTPGSAKVVHWRALALAAAKQSRRCRLMGVTDPLELNLVLSERGSGETCWALDLGAGTTPLSEAISSVRIASHLCLIIGPEGGFTDSETEDLRRAQVPRLSLGGHPLRTETAVVVSLGTIQQSLVSLKLPNTSK